MILKPCPICLREDAGCGCPPLYESVCRNCGCDVLSRTPTDSCAKCTHSEPFIFAGNGGRFPRQAG